MSISEGLAKAGLSKAEGFDSCQAYVPTRCRRNSMPEEGLDPRHADYDRGQLLRISLV
jgi:hypothetical protein